MLSKTKLILAALSTGLLGTILPPSYSNPNFDSESNYINNLDKLTKNNNSDIYIPKNNLDKFIINGATYSTKFVPLMNDGSDGSDYTSIMANDGKRLLVDAGFDFVNSTTNNRIQSIPFFAQTSVNVSGGTESDTSFSLNSLMKLGELARDDEGDIKTLAFSQARFATATNAEGSTTNLGLGIRHRPNDLSMLGANAFWDYKMTEYSDAHSRLGLGLSLIHI